jgi:hypothetical protein
LVSRLNVVVLPAPFGPMSAWIAPRRTWRFTPSTATKPLNSLVRPRVSRMTSGESPSFSGGSADADATVGPLGRQAAGRQKASRNS